MISYPQKVNGSSQGKLNEKEESVKKKRTIFSTRSLVDLAGSPKVRPQIAGICIMRPEISLRQGVVQAKCNLNRIPRKAVSKKVMLALLIIPIAAVINMDDAFAESFTVDQCAGGANQGNRCFYIPEKIMINVGDTVIWTNSDTVTHTITSGVVNDPGTWAKFFDSGLSKPGSTFEHTFVTAGEYPYLCQLHPWMIGNVLVKEGTILRGKNFDLNIRPIA